MGRKEEILEKVRGIAAPLAAQEGLELIDVELGGPGGRQTLRLCIDKLLSISKRLRPGERQRAGRGWGSTAQPGVGGAAPEATRTLGGGGA